MPINTLNQPTELESTPIKGKNFLICVSGGIAAYKALELVRFFKKRGGNVKVAMSRGALKFITPLSFEALSENPVLFDGSEDWGRGITHITYASWADVCIFAPATINSLSKFAYGMADNAMLSTMLACSAPILIAPAANTQMYLSPQAQEALTKLQSMGHIIISPKEDLLACGIRGIGAMAEVEEIAWMAVRAICQDSFWAGKKIIISGGGSSEDIDEVRCITNHSSGLQASYFALALFILGAEVIFVSSKNPIFMPSKIECIQARSTQDFYDSITHKIKNADYYFGIAALSDFIPSHKKQGKIKKQEGLKIDFIENIDLLKSLNGIKKIGFKAEKDVQNAKIYARKMLQDKKCEFVCLNIIDQNNPFGGENNKFSLISQEDEIEFALDHKFSLALSILDAIKTKTNQALNERKN